MKAVRSIATVGVLLASGSLSIDAQMAQTTDSRSPTLAGRHAITMSVGYMATSGDVSGSREGSRMNIEVSSHGLGWIGYGHWLTEEWAVQIETGGMGADLHVAGGFGYLASETSTVVPFLFGIRYQPSFTEATTVRPFLAVLAGPYVEFSTRSGTTPLFWEGRTRTTAGARVGVGVDFLASHQFTITSGLRYHLIGDFEWTDERRENYSGVEFVVGFGVLLGRAR